MNVGFAIMAGIVSMGITIDKIDESTNTIYFSIPKESYDYDDKNIKNADDLAKSIKEKFIDKGYFGKSVNMQYRISNVKWTKEKCDQALKKLKIDYKNGYNK